MQYDKVHDPLISTVPFVQHVHDNERDTQGNKTELAPFKVFVKWINPR